VADFSDGMVVLVLATNGKNQICASSKKKPDCGRSIDNNRFLSKWAAMEMQKVRIGMDGKIYPVSMPLRLKRTTLSI
jgi:hypothetical protein